MNSTKNIIVAATLSAIFSVPHLAAAPAAHGTQMLKPLQAVTFHAGTKHAVGYFLSDSSSCKLVLTLADDADFAPTRFEVAIEAGKSTRYQFANKSLEFACRLDARAMKVDSLETFATND